MRVSVTARSKRPASSPGASTRTTAGVKASASASNTICTTSIKVAMRSANLRASAMPSVSRRRA